MFASKHSKPIVSLCFTQGNDLLVTLSAEGFTISTTKGDTIAYLKQKSIGGIFLNRAITG